MDGVYDKRKKIGSVKAAMNLYGEGIIEGSSTLKKPHMDSSEPTPRKKELHQARRDIGLFSENRKVAESVKAQAESELSDAKKTVKELSLRIEESNSRAKTRIQDLEKLKKTKGPDEESRGTPRNAENYQYAEVLRELEHIKQELSKLKLDMASVLEEKRRAEKETKASYSRVCKNSSSLEALKKEIEELNEEQVLVELARIEALKEYGAIEAQRKNEASRYSSRVEETKKKANNLIQETDRAKELEMKLAITNSDVEMLQNQVALVKEMDKRIQRTESLRHPVASSQKGDESGSPNLLQSISEELEAAKKELASIKEEGFQFMASIDIIRDELKHVSKETARLKQIEDKADLTVQNLNSKLLRARAKLESVSAAEEKAKSIVSNLCLTLEQLKAEAEAAKKERELVIEDTAIIKAEVPKTESEIDLAEEKLQAAMQELEAIKSSEATALENLKNMVEDTMRARAFATQHSSTITISTFEYEYLTGRAVGAEEIADKKVAAAQSWIEALKASEKEILMKAETTQREIRELRVQQEQEVYRTETPLSAKSVVNGEMHKWGQKREPENLQFQVSTPRKTMNRNGYMTPARRAKFRKSGSPATRHISRSSSITKRKKVVMPNLAKLFK